MSRIHFLTPESEAACRMPHGISGILRATIPIQNQLNSMWHPASHTNISWAKNET